MAVRETTPSGFFTRSARQELETVPFPLGDDGPGPDVEALLASARVHRTTRFDLETVDFRDEAVAPFLVEVARLRTDELLGLSFRCRLPANVTAPQAELLGAAGVREAVLCATAGAVDGGGLHLNAHQLAAVRRLHAHDVAADWRLALAPGMGGAEADALLELIASPRHLPPPSGVRLPSADFEGEDPGPALVERFRRAIAAWRREHVPWRFTYARGPGFIRIFDRRHAETEWTFIVLHGMQAEIFLRCEGVTTSDELAAEFPDVAADRVGKFLDTLAARGVLGRVGSGAYLALPIRRKVEERWASGDVGEH